ncbi:hypothetical protein [Streptomyces scopuliridis]|uniref:hypothetical protein n=1 Tax=Streptomyces scopuliridis TaxID=452529 RepID=UPI0034224309
MADAILSLYRSAAQPALAQRGENLPKAAQRPGLAIIATGDGEVGSIEQRRRAAGRAGAEIHVLERLGHWWMLQDPAPGRTYARRLLGRCPTASDGATRASSHGERIGCFWGSRQE